MSLYCFFRKLFCYPRYNVNQENEELLPTGSEGKLINNKRWIRLPHRLLKALAAIMRSKGDGSVYPRAGSNPAIREFRGCG